MSATITPETAEEGSVLTGFELYLKRHSKKFDDYLATFFVDGTHPDMQRYLYGPLAR